LTSLLDELAELITIYDKGFLLFIHSVVGAQFLLDLFFFHGMPHLRLKLARQTGDQNDERMATFGWDQPIVSMKINVWNIGHLLNLLNEKNEKIAFYNETNKGATYVQGSFVNENEFDVKLTFSNPDEAPIDLFFQSNEVAVLKVFVETGLEKILYVNDFS
jgi:hypothetical protein